MMAALECPQGRKRSRDGAYAGAAPLLRSCIKKGPLLQKKRGLFLHVEKCLSATRSYGSMSSSDAVSTSFSVLVFSVVTTAFAAQHELLAEQQALATSLSPGLNLLVNGHPPSSVMGMAAAQDASAPQHPEVPFAAAGEKSECAVGFSHKLAATIPMMAREAKTDNTFVTMRNSPWITTGFRPRCIVQVEFRVVNGKNES
jgi:hypothetical protein